jgi:hypothetical protein
MYIYIITHPKFEGWIKLGRAKSIDNRLNGYQCYCPDRNFKLEYKIKTEYCYNIETYFDNFIEGNKREWYKCSVNFAIEKIHWLLDEISKNPNYFKKGKDCEDGIVYVQKKSKRSVLFTYLVGDIPFDSIRELGNYTGISQRRLHQELKNKTEIQIDDFKINKYNKKIK